MSNESPSCSSPMENETTLPATFPGLAEAAEAMAQEALAVPDWYQDDPVPPNTLWADLGPQGIGKAIDHRVDLLADFRRPASRDFWRHRLAERVGLDSSCGVTWSYDAAELHSVGCWTLRDASNKHFNFTDWRPEFEGLTKPSIQDRYLAIDNLPADPIEALPAAVLVAWAAVAQEAIGG